MLTLQKYVGNVQENLSRALAWLRSPTNGQSPGAGASACQPSQEALLAGESACPTFAPRCHKLVSTGNRSQPGNVSNPSSISNLGWHGTCYLPPREAPPVQHHHPGGCDLLLDAAPGCHPGAA